MNLVPVPEHRALLGIDVVGSASNPGYHLDAVPEAVNSMLSEALRNSGIDLAEVLTWEPTGDGALLTLPSTHLGALLDAAQRLDMGAAMHNRRYKPEVRLRIAVEVGPVGEEPGFYATKIALSRLLESEEFKSLFGQCREEASDDAVNTALIISEQVLRAAFSGDHTRFLRRSDFGQLNVQNKEHSDTAWVRVPGFDARSLTAFTTPQPEAPTPSVDAQVSNVVHGNQYGVQAHTVNDGVRFGVGPR